MATLSASKTIGKSIKVLERNAKGQPLSVAICDGKETCSYDILFKECIEDGVLHRIKKTSGHKDVGAIYDVFIAAEYPTCDCPGFVYKGRCKHVQSFTALTLREGQRRPIYSPVCHEPVALEEGDTHCKECNGTKYRRVTTDAKQSVFLCQYCDGSGITTPF